MKAPRDQRPHARVSAVVLLLGVMASSGAHTGAPAPTALPNDNRVAAGRLVRDTLVLRLTVVPVAWRMFEDDGPAFDVLAFAEEGQRPTIPGPLVRVREGTPIDVTVRNPLDDTLFVRGLGARGDGAMDVTVVPPRATTRARFVAGRAGTYQYWGFTTATRRHDPPLSPVPSLVQTGLVRLARESQLAGAFVVDAPGARRADRVLVITGLTHTTGDAPLRDRHGTLAREFMAINGKTWPHTERFTFAVGDSVRWRLVNATGRPHPMHLHGFYFRVDANGGVGGARNEPTGDWDSTYVPTQRRMAVTEMMSPGSTRAIVWSPSRPGGWIFHCHITQHAAKLPPADRPDSLEYPSMHDHGDPDRHALTGMNGLVLATTVRGAVKREAPWRPARRLRLLVQSDSAAGDSLRRFGYVLQRSDAEPRADSVESPGPVLVLTRDEPTSIEVVNRTPEPTAVHWHGIEIESYYDGPVGWAGTAARRAPAIRPGRSFEVRMTPPRAGTFMYHTHFDEMRQQRGGLVGALVVLEPGERWDPERDLVFLVSDGASRRALVNGSPTPPARDLRVGTTYRLRIANLGVDRAGMPVRLVRDSTLVTWRAVAKDGFTLPDVQARAGPSTARVGSGETADFEFTPHRAGDLRLAIGFARPDLVVRLRVSEATR